MFKKWFRQIGAYWWIPLMVWFIVNTLRITFNVPIPIDVYGIISLVLVVLIVMSRL